MADEMRCPNCGESNPPEAERCRFCSEPLTPGAAGETADWLSSLRSGDWEETAGKSPEGEEPPTENEIPDWLARVRARNQSESAADEPAFGLPGDSDEPASDGGLDWLQNLSQVPSGADDWLSNLSEKPSESESSEPTGEVPAPLESPSFEAAQVQQPGDETPAAEGAGDDWLAQLSSADFAQAQPEGGESEFTFAPETGLESPVPGAPEGENEMADWFAQLDQPADQGAASERAPQEEGAQPDWMGQPAGEQAGEPESAEPEQPAEVPAWLADFTASQPSQDEAPQAAETTGAELPDWLAGAATEEPEAAPSSAEASAELPDWLKTGGDEPLASAAETSAIPDFSALEELGSPLEEPGEPLEGEGISPFGSEELAFEPPSTPGDTEREPGEEMAPAGELAALLGLTGLAAAGEEEKAEPAEETPEWLHTGAEEAGEAPTPAEAEVPDWLKNFSQAAEPASLDLSAPLPEAPEPFVDDEAPDWLSNIQPPETEAAEPSVPALIEEPDTTSPEELKVPFQVELPEWLDQQPPADLSTPAAELPAEEAAEELEKAELPTWVEDLRPLEAVIPGDVRKDSSESVIEKAGPLAGLRGVLQSEDLSTGYRKPPVYSARLRVSERQRSQAAILENLLAMETAPKAVPAEPSRAPAMILRVVIALLLILSLLTMLLPDFRLVDPPAVYPSNVSALYDGIEGLPAESAVLLAVDYEPGLSTEMRYAANAVIEHLMVKNARLLVVSTVPTGPVLAEQLLTEVQLRRPGYSLADRTVNLGYLPGGTTSLLEFAHNPQGAAPAALDTPLTGLPAWDHLAAQGLSGLADFAMVIVLTDSPETGRAWIEQVQPVLSGVPLSMVTSAQAGPLLLPYYDSGQVQGMTSGLQGGVLYEQKSGRVNLANRFWGTFQSGSLAGFLLLVIGGIISAVLGSPGRKPAQKGKA